MTYQPKPIDTAHVQLPPQIEPLIEKLAEHNHDIWAAARLSQGWTFGAQRDDAEKKHPDLVPYAELSETEKQYDRNAAVETLKAIVALGYRVDPPG